VGAVVGTGFEPV